MSYIADIISGVWSRSSRTLDLATASPSDGTYVSDVSHAVWSYWSRTLNGKVVSAKVDASGLEIVVVFQSAATNHGGFTVVAESPIELAYTSGDGTNSLTFSTSRVVGSHEVLGLVYTPGSVLVGGEALDHFTGQQIENESDVDLIPPEILSAVATDTTLTLTYSESVTGQSGFTLSTDLGIDLTLTAAGGNGTPEHTFLSNRNIGGSEKLTLSSTGGPVDSAGLPLAAFTGYLVANASPRNSLVAGSVITVARQSRKVVWIREIPTRYDADKISVDPSKTILFDAPGGVNPSQELMLKVGNSAVVVTDIEIPEGTTITVPAGAILANGIASNLGESGILLQQEVYAPPPTDVPIFFNLEGEQYWTRLPFFSNIAASGSAPTTGRTSYGGASGILSDGHGDIITLHSSGEAEIIVALGRDYLKGKGFFPEVPETWRLAWDDPSNAISLCRLSGSGETADNGDEIVTVSGNRKYKDYTITPFNYTILIKEAGTHLATTMKLFPAAQADPANPDRPSTVMSAEVARALRGFRGIRSSNLTRMNNSNVGTFAQANRVADASISTIFPGSIYEKTGVITQIEMSPINPPVAHPEAGGWLAARCTSANHGLTQGEWVTTGNPTISLDGGAGTAFLYSSVAHVIDADTFDLSTWTSQGSVIDPATVSIAWHNREGWGTAPISHLVQACNEGNLDLWYPCPCLLLANVAEFRLLADYVAENLNPGLRFIVEPPNENWNGMFWQWTQKALFSHLDGISSSTWLVRKSKAVWQAARDAWTSQGRDPDTGVVRYLAGWATSYNYNSQLVAAMESEDAVCDAIGFTAYYGSEPAGGGGTGVLPSGDPEVLCDLAYVGNLANQWSNLDVFLPLYPSRVTSGLLFYEGGPSVLSYYRDWLPNQTCAVSGSVVTYVGSSGLVGPGDEVWVAGVKYTAKSTTDDAITVDGSPPNGSQVVKVRRNASYTAHAHPGIGDSIHAVITGLKNYGEKNSIPIVGFGHYRLSGSLGEGGDAQAWGAITHRLQEFDTPASLPVAHISGNNDPDMLLPKSSKMFALRQMIPSGVIVISTGEATPQKTTASIGGNVTYDGGYTIIERGVCYSLSPEPTIADPTVSSGGGVGVFTVDLVGLVPETTYYARAYATNSEGTSYGNEVSFVTLTAKSWQLMPGRTSKTLTIPGVTAGDFGRQFRCVVTNPVGSATSRPAGIAEA